MRDLLPFPPPVLEAVLRVLLGTRRVCACALLGASLGCRGRDAGRKTLPGRDCSESPQYEVLVPRVAPASKVASERRNPQVSGMSSLGSSASRPSHPSMPSLTHGSVPFHSVSDPGLRQMAAPWCS